MNRRNFDLKFSNSAAMTMHKSAGDTHKFLFHRLLCFPGSEEHKEII